MNVLRSALLALICAFSIGPASALEVIKGSKLVQVSNLDLRPKVKRQFNRFLNTQNAFGSFFVGNGGAESGWSFAMHSQSAADALAKTQCEVRSNGPCVPYARLLPVNSVGKIAVPAIFNRNVINMKDYSRPGQFAAMAVNGVGGTAFAYSTRKKPLETRQAARTSALESCHRSSSSTKKNYGKKLHRPISVQVCSIAP